MLDFDTFYKSFTGESARLGLDGPSILPSSSISLYDEIDSTNSELLRQLQEKGFLPSFTLAAAACQTAGRGRIGRRFYSPAQDGIYFSFIYAPEKGVTVPGRCTVSAAVAVCRAIDSLYGIHSGIKWVNDVYISGRKVCGILTEGWSPAPAQGERPLIKAAVIGIGINIRAGCLPEELANKAAGVADMALQLGCPPDRAGSVSREMILAYCMANVIGILTRGEDILSEYSSRSILTGREVTVIPIVGDERGRYKARVLGIGENLSLRVRTQDGQEKEISSGEVSLKLTEQ
ncbi:MAG: biotin--[Treponema sp.]|nr:biotin--[acetyl-CoA-carboxylase] ligase [Treponema sp.]